jgi:hypothetical protein
MMRAAQREQSELRAKRRSWRSLLRSSKAAPEAPAGIERLSGARAAQALLANAFTWELGQKILGNPRAQFDQCLTVANRAAVFRVRREWGMDRFDEEAEAIERHLQTPLD